jgi:hypothetical protein
MKHFNLAACRRAAGWLFGAALLIAGTSALAQQDPPGRVASLNFHQGTVSFSPAGDDSWYDVVPNRPLTTGDRLWTDRNARAEVYVGAVALRLDDQTDLAVSELDDDTARLTTLQGSLQLRVRDDLAGQRLEIDTGNLAVVIETPGDYRIEADPTSGTTHVAVMSGAATLYGDGGESVAVRARQEFTMSGRNLTAVNAASMRTSGAFESWVAERDRLEDQSIAARYVSREVVGYQQLDNYGDWQNDADYGSVWYPRNVDAEWAPYRDGQWVDVAPWGWTWVDAAPWGFAPSHYGRWARIGPRWGWVPGRPGRRPVYAPALVGFVGGAGPGAGLAIGGGRNGVGWFPLAPGEAWRPSYRASQRYIDQANRGGTPARQNAVRAAEFAHRNTPGAVTIVPVDMFGRGPMGRRDTVRLTDDRMARAPVGTAVPVPLRGDRQQFNTIGRPAAVPAPAFTARQPQFQPRAAQAIPVQQAPQAQQWQQMQQAQQIQRSEVMRQQQDAQRAAQAQQQMQIQRQQQQAARQQSDAQERAAQAQAQREMRVQQQNAMRQQQEMQQRSAQAQAQQAQQAQIQQQQSLRMQQQQQMQQQMQQQNAARQAQEAQQQGNQRGHRGGRDPSGTFDRP